MLTKTFRLLSLGLFTVALAGCVATMVGAATVVAIDVMHDRRTVGAYIDDGAIEVNIRQHILRNEKLRQQTHINPTSMNGIVLLTGEVRNDDVRNQVVSYARQITGVRQVVDETEIAGKTGLMSRTTDSWLTTKVKSTLYAETGFDASRVKVVTERGTVYLMGVVSREEASEAVEVVRYINGVVRVVKVFEYT